MDELKFWDTSYSQLIDRVNILARIVADLDEVVNVMVTDSVVEVESDAPSFDCCDGDCDCECGVDCCCMIEDITQRMVEEAAAPIEPHPLETLAIETLEALIRDGSEETRLGAICLVAELFWTQ